MTAIERFIEQMGLLSQEGGGARIAGRIFGLLLVEGREMSLHEISERLQVSRASVSTNARELAKRSILRLTSHAGDRQDYYELSESPYFTMLEQMAEQFHRHARVIAECIVPMEGVAPEALQRIGDLSNFYEKSAEILQNWAVALREDKAPHKDVE
ncbi:hypothetical protein WH87_00460 [Devosia epidermidihirudinis]|uniref:HTH marR-type domain-containing protein n=1 Tax=Devosia epidermidihirudinis TaxID=1293439 RepID=A0A0F5QKG9_9HYPH|nr:MarR family transcriptional regulator [Devosia epidermidihirudinis]KKC41460.1 hypothetical protein WH87_00460 [Devosia epidermidihirudinis]